MGFFAPDRIVDADGHIFEDFAAIMDKVPSSWGNTQSRKTPFPDLDHIHHHLHVSPPGSFIDPGGAKGWGGFLSEVGVQRSVLYPTRGLAFGRIMDLDWANGIAKAYNDWIHEAYVSQDPRLHAVGLIPMQDPESAVMELRRIVTELGFSGGMLPSTGLKTHLGDKEYWPIYEEANRLGCALSLHGGAHSGLGLDTWNIFAGVHALGHPSGITIWFVSLLFNGVFDRFPNVKFGFLEGGVGWLLMARERCGSSYRAFTAMDPMKRYFDLKENEQVEDYIMRQIDEDRIFVGVEGDEPDLPYAVKVFGNKPFMFSTDFPHEVNAELCKHEITEVCENDELTDEDKAAIMYLNAERFYSFSQDA